MTVPCPVHGKVWTTAECPSCTGPYLPLLDWSSITWSDTPPTVAGWWTAKRIESGDCCILEVNGDEKWLLLYQWGPMVAPITLTGKEAE